MMSTRLFLISLLLINSGQIRSETSNGIQDGVLNHNYTVPTKSIVSVAGCCLLSYLCYRITNILIDSYIEQNTIDLITLSLKPCFRCTSQELRKKAQFVCRRKRIMRRLKEVCDVGKLRKIELAFKVIDTFKFNNPYEKDYEIPTIIDFYVEKRIIQSIILHLKSEHECNAYERVQKKLMKQNQKKTFCSKKCYKNSRVAWRFFLA